MIEPVLLLHGYDSKPSTLADLADRLGRRAELVAGFEDLPNETFAWWVGDLSIDARHDLTEYLDEISEEANRALQDSKVPGLAGMLASKGANLEATPTASSVSAVGFSQGASAVYSWLLDPLRQTSMNVVIAVAGFLPDLAEHQLRGHTISTFDQDLVHIHAVHLSDDEVVDAMVTERASRLLVKSGFTVTDHFLEGPHAWSSALNDLVAQLLNRESD